ncbi:MAG: glycosyltransferase [Candidatus Omnitrophica bacterium]|nr:glycosyltransferase [Candidatus Omnitrophota bacterium]
MKILLVHNYYQQPGGEDIVFAAEASLLRRHGHEVVEYTEDNQRINEAGRVAAAINAVWSRSSRRKLVQILRNTRPDVVHFHNTFPLISPSVYYVCRDAGVPVVQTLHNYRLLCPTATLFRGGEVCEDCLNKIPPWPGVLHACYHRSRAQTAVIATMLTVHRLFKTWQREVDIYITPSEFARRIFVKGGLPQEKIIVKPNFLCDDPGMREKEGKYVLFAGRLSREKGIITLLEAWQNLKEIPLKIAGDGPLMDEVRAFVRKEGFKHVEVLGWRDRKEVLTSIKEARFLVLPSEWYEVFPLIMPEVFACSVPIIASGLGAGAEIIREGQNGLHFLPGNAKDLASKVEWAWTHKKEMEGLGKNARRDYEEKYTAEENYKKLTDIYKLAIERSKKR